MSHDRRKSLHLVGHRTANAFETQFLQGYLPAFSEEAMHELNGAKHRDNQVGSSVDA